MVVVCVGFVGRGVLDLVGGSVCGGEGWCVSVWPHDATGTITMVAGV